MLRSLLEVKSFSQVPHSCDKELAQILEVGVNPKWIATLQYVLDSGEDGTRVHIGEDDKLRVGCVVGNASYHQICSNGLTQHRGVEVRKGLDQEFPGLIYEVQCVLAM